MINQSPPPWTPVPPPKPEPYRCNHVLHLLLTLLTGGLWIPAWALSAWSANDGTRREARQYEQQYAAWATEYHRRFGPQWR